MKILVIGGTQFVGRHFVEAALQRDHEVTLFNRGKTNPGLFPNADEIVGDRMEDVDVLRGRWDVAVDTSAYVPRAVRLSGEHLRDRVDRYLFISTTAVYRDFSTPGIDESAYLKTLEDPDLEELNTETYGPLKTECEAVVTGLFDRRCFIVRPGIIVGPHDPTDRFTYWVWRVGNGGEVLAPGEPSVDVQIIDARDLARWLVHGLEEGMTGIYNATGPATSFEEMLNACRRATGSDATMTWVPERFMKKVEIDTPQKMPLWNPDPHGRKAGLYAVDSSRAQEKRLQWRSLEQTARATWEWIAEDAADHDWRVGLDLLEEREILTLWHRGKR